jgi:tetratricopeptide (TPR) repeat protein
MKSRVLVMVILLAGSALAQLDEARTGLIDGIPNASAELEGKFNSAANPTSYASGALVSASSLAVPARARKEFDKANQLLRKQEWTQALQKLNKAVSIDPAFVGAYNNLGVVYARLGNPAREREALQKAIDLDDHFALAYVNLGRMDIARADFPAAEAALDKASTLDATDPTALVLLAYAELMQGHLQQTVATSQKAHALGEPHAFAHRLAARAWEQEGQFDRAITELTRSLEEEPSGARADSARKELAIMQVIPR